MHDNCWKEKRKRKGNRKKENEKGIGRKKTKSLQQGFLYFPLTPLKLSGGEIWWLMKRGKEKNGKKWHYYCTIPIEREEGDQVTGSLQSSGSTSKALAFRLNHFNANFCFCSFQWPSDLFLQTTFLKKSFSLMALHLQPRHNGTVF